MTELEAISAISAALEQLDLAARKRVLDWATSKYVTASLPTVAAPQGAINLPFNTYDYRWITVDPNLHCGGGIVFDPVPIGTRQ